MAFSTPEKQSEYNRQYYLKNRDRMREQMRLWREKNSDKYRAKSMEYHWKNRENLLEQKRARWQANADEINVRRREKKFGIAVGVYDTMVIAQNGCCDCCGEKRKLVVDHNHATGTVRALLCSQCNTALGLLKEDTRLIWRVIEYVAAHKAKAPAILPGGAA